MDVRVERGGAAVDERLSPAGLTRLLGSYGAGRISILALALTLVAGSLLARVLAPVPSLTIGVACILAVTLVAAESGTSAGLKCAAAAIVAIALLALLGWSGESVTTVVGRAGVLLFLAPVIGRATERAASSRRLLEQVLEATTDSIYVKDLDGRYLLLNSATARLIGQPARDIVGLTNAELLPEVADEVAAHDSAVLDNGSPSSYEITGRFGEERRILSVTKSPFRDAAGNPIGSLGIARDITLQRRLQEESTRFFELSGDMLCTVDFSGRLHRVNGEWEKRLGWTADELLGASIFEFTPSADHPAMAAATRAARVPGAPGGRVTSRWRAKDGSWHWIDWSLRTVDEERTIYASGRDVTQELLAERALASSESRYRALVHGLPGTAVFLVERRPAPGVRGRPAAARRRDRPERADRRPRRRDPPRPRGEGARERLRRGPRRQGVQLRHRRFRARPRAVGAHELAAQRGLRRHRRRDAHRPGRPRARRARARDRRGAGTLPARVRGRPDRHGRREPRWPLPRGQPGAVPDHRVHARAADRDDVLGDHAPRRPRRRLRRDARAGRRGRRVAGRREALPAPGRLERVGRAQRHARARRRRRAAALPRPDPGHHRAPSLRARAAPPRRPRPADRPAQPPALRAGARPPRRRGGAVRPPRRPARPRSRPLQVRSTTPSATTPATS